MVTPMGELNDQANNLAKQHLDYVQLFPPPTQRTLAGEGWSIFIDGVKENSFNMDKFYNLTSGEKVSRANWKH